MKGSNKKNRKTTLAILLLIPILCIALSACSFTSAPSKDTKSNVATDEAATPQAPSIGELMEKGEDVPLPYIPTVLDNSKILSPNEVLHALYPITENENNPGLDYTLKSAAIFDTPEAAGLDKSQMREDAECVNPKSEYYPTEFSLYDISDCQILVVELTIKNISHYNQYDNSIGIAEMSPVYADPQTGEIVVVCIFPLYFSASKSEPNQHDFAYYLLAKDQSIDVKVAYPILPEFSAENLYLRSLLDGQYFQLSLN
ncbi:hypothetical protein LQZ18_09590 [Lachnospiraceae bacterium ZAX-1]